MPSPRPRSRSAALGWACAAVVLAVVGQNAWVCDDAFITLRVVDHAWAGRGLVFNEGWRVQAYTHPAWMALLAVAYGLLGSGFWAAVACGVVTTAAALWLGLVRLARGPVTLVIAVALLGSRAFVDYSTAGLENPLTHLVVGLAAWAYLGEVKRIRAFARVCGCTGLAFLCRPDAPLVLLPLVFALAWQARARGAGVGSLLRGAAWGVAPVLAWELFSLVYYGALLPNTAIAKLGTDLPLGERLVAGGRYLLDTAIADRVTAVALVAGGVACWRRAPTRPFALGALAQLAYIGWIGGDFMAGRFLTVPLWLLALGVARLRIGRRAALVVCAGLGLMGLLSARPPVLTGPASVRTPPPRPRWGVADERAHYAAAASVWAWSPGESLPRHAWRDRAEQEAARGPHVVVFDTLGYFGFFAGPRVHVVDRIALTDPLLARLPPLRRLEWRPGHLARPVPHGYLDALAHDDPSRIDDPAVRELFEDLVLAHRAPLGSAERWAALWRLHTGISGAEIDRARYVLLDAPQVQARRVLPRRQPVRVRDLGLRVVGLDAGTALRLSVEPEVPLELRWLRAGERLTTQTLPAGSTTLHVPADADGLHLLPLAMGGAHSLQIGLDPAPSEP